MAGLRDVTWRFINLAPVAGGQAALDDLFAETLSPFGVDRFDCVRLSAPSDAEPSGLISDHGLSAWKHYFFEQGYHQIDPCPPACSRFQGAYTWTDVKSVTAGRVAAPIWSDARAGGMREGLIVPTASRRLTGAIVRLTTPEDRFDPGVVPLLQSISVIYASSTMAYSTNLLQSWSKIEVSGILTDREIECLHWSARGKTNSEIGVILNISRHTVNTHIESAKRKLGVSTRVQAAAMAHRLGLLSIA